MSHERKIVNDEFCITLFRIALWIVAILRRYTFKCIIIYYIVDYCSRWFSYLIHLLYENSFFRVCRNVSMSAVHRKFIEDSPPVTVSKVNALNFQLPTWLSIHCTWPWCISSKMAVSWIRARVASFLRLRLCIVRKRPVHAKRRRGCSNFSSATRASINGRSRSESGIRTRWTCDDAVYQKK